VKTLSDFKISARCIHEYNASKEDPLCIHAELLIPVNVNGRIEMKLFKANEDIDAFVKRKYGDLCFAVVQSDILEPGESCITANLNESNGFTLKSWLVHVRRIIKRDLSACKSISDVLHNVKGQKAFHNNKLTNY